MACGILVPHPGIEPMPPAVEAWTIRELDHWTIRELLLTLSLKACPWKATGVFGSSESQLPGLLNCHFLFLLWVMFGSLSFRLMTCLNHVVNKLKVWGRPPTCASSDHSCQPELTPSMSPCIESNTNPPPKEWPFLTSTA